MPHQNFVRISPDLQSNITKVCAESGKLIICTHTDWLRSVRLLRRVLFISVSWFSLYIIIHMYKRFYNNNGYFYI